MRQPNESRAWLGPGIAALIGALALAACGGKASPADPGPSAEELARRDSIEAARRAEEERERLEAEARAEAERRRAEEEARLQAEEARAAAQERKASGREHVVRRGDTLWDLAAYYLNDPFRWALIYEANRGVVEDPHWIYPLERLIIPGLAPLPADAVAGAMPAAVKGAPARPRRTRFYSERAAPSAEEGRTIGGAAERRSLLIPQVRPGDFYTAPWLGKPQALPVVGRIVSVAGRRTERLRETVHPFDEVYLSYLTPEPPAIGDRVLLVHPGREVEPWGWIIAPAAIATVSAHHEQVMAAVVTEAFGVLEEGALAIPLERYPGEIEEPVRPVEDGAEGVLIAFEVPQPLPSPRDRAFINLGRADGVEVGDEFVAYEPPRRAPATKLMLPAEVVARLRVVRVAERSATVQVVRLDQPALREGMPVRLVAKRP